MIAQREKQMTPISYTYNGNARHQRRTMLDHAARRAMAAFDRETNRMAFDVISVSLVASAFVLFFFSWVAT